MEITKDHNYMEGVWAAKSLPNYIQNTEYVTIEQAIVVKQELIDNFEKEFGYHTDMDEYDRNYSYNYGMLDQLKNIINQNQKE
jgi:hypothetical protein